MFILIFCPCFNEIFLLLSCMTLYILNIKLSSDICLQSKSSFYHLTPISWQIYKFIVVTVVIVSKYKVLLYCCSITVVCIFSPPLPTTPAKHASLLASTLPLGFVHLSFIVVPENPSPHCPLPPPLWLLLDCS